MKASLFRHIFLLLLIVFTLPASSLGAAPLRAYLTEAFNNNDDIAAAQKRLIASRHKARQTGTLPDPQFRVEYFLEPIETRTGPQEAAIGLTQGVPWPGKLSLEKKISFKNTAILEKTLAATELSVASKVKQNYVEYGFNFEEIKVLKEHLELLKYFENVARTKYTAGKFDYANMLKIQVEMAMVANSMATANDRSVSLLAILNSLLGADSEIARPKPDLPNIVLTVNEEEIVSASLSNNPGILAAKEKISKAKLALELAEKEFYPNLSFSLKTILTGNAEFGNPPDSGDDPVIAAVNLNIPIFQDRQLGAIEEKEATIEEQEAALEQMIRRTKAEIAQVLFLYRNAVRSKLLYQDTLLSSIQQELEVELEAFKNDRLSVLELIDTQKNLLRFYLASIKSKADQAIAIAKLEELAGIPLVDWQ